MRRVRTHTQSDVYHACCRHAFGWGCEFCRPGGSRSCIPAHGATPPRPAGAAWLDQRARLRVGHTWGPDGSPRVSLAARMVEPCSAHLHRQRKEIALVPCAGSTTQRCHECRTRHPTRALAKTARVSAISSVAPSRRRASATREPPREGEMGGILTF